MSFLQRILVVLAAFLAVSASIALASEPAALPPPLARRVAASIHWLRRHIKFGKGSMAKCSQAQKDLIAREFKPLEALEAFVGHAAPAQLRRPRLFIATAIFMKPAEAALAKMPRRFLMVGWLCLTPSADGVIIFANNSPRWLLPMDRRNVKPSVEKGVRSLIYLALLFSPRGMGAKHVRADTADNARPGGGVMEYVNGRWRPARKGAVAAYLRKHASGHLWAAMARGTRVVSNRLWLAFPQLTLTGKSAVTSEPGKKGSSIAKFPSSAEAAQKRTAGPHGVKAPAVNAMSAEARLQLERAHLRIIRKISRMNTLPYLKLQIVIRKRQEARLQKRLASAKPGGKGVGAGRTGKIATRLAYCREAIAQWSRALLFFQHLKPVELRRPTLLRARAYISNEFPGIAPPILCLKVYYASRRPIASKDISLTVFRRGKVYSVARHKVPAQAKVPPHVWLPRIFHRGPYIHLFLIILARNRPLKSAKLAPGALKSEYLLSGGPKYFAALTVNRRLFDFAEHRLGRRIQIGFTLKGKVVGKKIYAFVSQD